MCPLWSTTKTTRPRTLVSCRRVQDAVQRNDGGQHSGKLIVHLQRHGHDECRAVLGADGQRVAAEDQGLQRRGERALQRLGYKGVLVRPGNCPRRCPWLPCPRRSDTGYSDCWRRSFRGRGRLAGRSRCVVDFIDQACEGQDLPFADQLLVEIGVKLLDFFGQGARHFGLLDALRVGQFCLAKLQNLHGDRAPAAAR